MGITQTNAYQYGNANNIQGEFANVIRYLKSVEQDHGDKTLTELLNLMIDKNGKLSVAFQIRVNGNGKIEYRFGNFNDPEEAWVEITTLAELRGLPGVNYGELADPIFTNRHDVIATNLQTDFDYAFGSNDRLVVFRNGMLQVPDGASTQDYDTDSAGGANGAGVVQFTNGVNAGDKITIMKVREGSSIGYTRQDFTQDSSPRLTAGTDTVQYQHGDNTTLFVYYNGVLLEPAGGGNDNDYTASATENTIQFHTFLDQNGAAVQGKNNFAASDKVTVWAIDQLETQTVAGIMLEDNYTDRATGLIRTSRIKFDDNGLPVSKIENLTDTLNTKGNTYVQDNEPDNPRRGDVWLNTAVNPVTLSWHNGQRWRAFDPNNAVPEITDDDDGKLVFAIDGIYQLANLDLSSLIPANEKGRQNGVVPLNNRGLIDPRYLPEILGFGSMSHTVANPTDNDFYVIEKILNPIVIQGVYAQTDSGTCSIQLAVNGVVIGDDTDKIAVKAGGDTIKLTNPIQVVTALEGDQAGPKTVGFQVTNDAAAANLEVVLAYGRI